MSKEIEAVRERRTAVRRAAHKLQKESPMTTEGKLSVSISPDIGTPSDTQMVWGKLDGTFDFDIYEDNTIKVNWTVWSGPHQEFRDRMLAYLSNIQGTPMTISWKVGDRGESGNNSYSAVVVPVPGVAKFEQLTEIPYPPYRRLILIANESQRITATDFQTDVVQINDVVDVRRTKTGFELVWPLSRHKKQFGSIAMRRHTPMTHWPRLIRAFQLWLAESEPDIIHRLHRNEPSTKANLDSRATFVAVAMEGTP